MHILYITQYFPPEIGAASSRAYDFIHELQNKGIQVTVIAETPHYPGYKSMEGYRNRWFLKETYQNIRIIRSYAFISRRKNFIQRTLLYFSYLFSSIIASCFVSHIDLVIASSPPITVGLAGMIISHLKGCKFILDIRDIWPESAIALGEIKNRAIIQLLQSVESLLYHKADRITVAVPGFRNHICSLDIPESKIKSLPNGADTRIFYSRQDTGSIKATYNWNRRFIVLFSGNHGLAQGLESIMQTAALLRNKKDIQFVFIGDGVEKDKLQKMKDKLDLFQVQFIEKQPREEMPRFISCADICIVPLVKHTLFLNALPSKMFEYMACEKPLILAIDGEARVLIEKWGSGIYVEPENIVQLKKAILKLYKSKDLLPRMGKKGKALVLKKFCRQDLAEKFAQMIQETVRRED